MSDKVDFKIVQDCYNLLQGWFDEDSINARLSGVDSGELEEMNKLLAVMKEVEDEADERERAKKDISQEKNKKG